MAVRDRQFLGIEYFRAEGDYYLLPFRFHPISATREVLVNELGDWLLCPRGTAGRLARHELKRDDPLFADLQGSFFVSDTPVPDLVDVMATRYRTKKAFLDPFTSLHIFVTTLRCNHSCHYCQVSRQTQDRSRYDMSRSHLERAIDLMFRSPASDLTVEFQGGEPALAFDVVEHAVSRIVRLNEVYRRKITFVLCTNLTLITDAILSFCATHDILISTSLDGPSFVHDMNRPKSGSNSFQLFEEALETTRAALGLDRVSALMTTSRLSLDHAEAIIDKYVELGFSHIFLRPIHPYGFATRLPSSKQYKVDQFVAFYKRALAYIIELNRRGIPLVEDYAAIMLRKILTPFPVGFVDLQSPSGAVNSVVVYNYDGAVYASDESRMLAETGDVTFCLGQVTDDYEDLFYGPAARRVTTSSVNEALAGCSDCGFQAYCGADPVRHHATQSDMEGYRPTSDFCRKHMELFRWLFELMDTDRAVERIFRQWT